MKRMSLQRSKMGALLPTLSGGARIAAGASLFVLALWTQGTRSPAAAADPAPLNMKFVKVAAGEFTMGCSPGDEGCSADERPAHLVKITRPFEIGAYEVTQAQWTSVAGSNPSANKGDDRPVEMVAKTDVEGFLATLNARNDGYRYRLPTEAEWEYAARAGSKAGYEGSLDTIAWYAGNSGDESHPVGRKAPNAWGLYDTAGNVREWVADQYSATYYASSPADDPTGPPPGRGGGPGGRPGRPGGPRGRGFGPPPDGFGPPDGGRRGFGPPPFGPPPEGFSPPPDGGPPEFGPPDGGPPPQDGAQVAPNGTSSTEPQGGNPEIGSNRGGRRGRGGPPGGRDLPVIRGGAWDNPAPYLRESARYNYYGPTLRVSDLGFRVVRVAIP
jgi:formylglycine-generating enzyme required for sulfatase activity